jgi:hypothetical protein
MTGEALGARERGYPTRKAQLEKSFERSSNQQGVMVHFMTENRGQNRERKMNFSAVENKGATLHDPAAVVCDLIASRDF